MWVANQYSGTVSRIDPRRDQVVASVDVGGAPTSLTMSRGRLWVGVAADSGGHRGGTLVIVTPETLTSSNPMTLTSVDPAFYDGAFNPQFTGLAYDALVTFQQSPGADGMRLVPDLALSIPAPADGGTTYAFRIRPGIRYSDGQRLRASDFRRGIERLFRVHSPGTSYYAGLVGAAACAQHPAGCDLSRGIVTDDATGSVVFHLAAPDPDFLFNLTQFAFAAPVPPGTPDHETDSGAVPGTGPYKIASVSDTEVRFVRNPYFREWSHAAQPAGNPGRDRVADRADGASRGDRGRAGASRLDVRPGPGRPVPPARTPRPRPAALQPPVRRRVRAAQHAPRPVQRRPGPAGAQLRDQPAHDRPAVWGTELRHPNLPGDRARPARLPPLLPVHAASQSDGAWSAPDLARARQLVAQSGTLGERVDVWGSPDEGFIPPATAAYIAGVLRALGYRVRLHLIPFASITEAMDERFQLSVDGDWLANYPDPSSYLPSFFGCGGGTSNGYYCSPALDREMHQAELARTQ